MDTEIPGGPSRSCSGGQKQRSQAGIGPLRRGVLLGLIAAALITACAAPAPPPTATPASGPLPTPAPGATTADSARPVSAVVADDQPYVATVSPDGTRIAWFNETGRGKERNGRICLFTFANAAKQCYNFPAGKFLGYPYQLQWSPDGKRIAFTENAFQLAYDSDIWIMNVAEGTYADLTDDSVTGRWTYQAGAPQAMVDYLPMWNPSDGRIYFWRVLPQGYPKYQFGLYSVAPEGGAPAALRDLTTAMPNQIPTFDYQQFFMDGSSAISPDGTKIAALLSAFSEMGATSTNLWQIDLKQASAAPQQLMTFENFQSAIPQWAAFPANPRGLSWTADGKGIVTTALANDLNGQAPFLVFYYAAADGSGYKPVVDFSGLADEAAYFAAAQGSSIPWRAYSPWTASLSPKGDKLLMLNDLSGSMGLFTAPLPPNGALPPVSAAVQQSLNSTSVNSSRSSDGKLLIHGLLMTVHEP
jgi:Tol biopolymer transport system component